MGAVVLNGAVVERGAFVAAGCVVPPGGRVPAGMLAVGNPMRIIREVGEAENASTANGLAFYKHYARVYRAIARGGVE
jgi:carbonic anhydrase/acetyltransferase-like protein (isoleucine patch superfamily)